MAGPLPTLSSPALQLVGNFQKISLFTSALFCFQPLKDQAAACWALSPATAGEVKLISVVQPPQVTQLSHQPIWKGYLPTENSLEGQEMYLFFLFGRLLISLWCLFITWRMIQPVTWLKTRRFFCDTGETNSHGGHISWFGNSILCDDVRTTTACVQKYSMFLEKWRVYTWTTSSARWLTRDLRFPMSSGLGICHP